MGCPTPTETPTARRRALGAALAALALGPALVGCDAPAPPFRVGAIAFAGYSFLFLGQDLGMLEGSSVRVHELRSNTDVLRALATGRLEAAALTLDEVLTAVHHGLPLKVVAVLDLSAGADAVIGRPGSDRTGALRGQRVAVEGSAAGALMLSAFLEASGLQPGDMRLVPRPLPETAAALRDGQADLAVTAEPWASQLEAEGGVRLFDSRAIPGRIVDVLAVRADALAAQPAALRRVVETHFAALSAFQRQPEALFERLAPRLQLAPATVLSAFRGLDLPGRETNLTLLSTDGTVAQGLPALARLLLDKGLIASPVDPAGLIDTRWLGPGP